MVGQQAFATISNWFKQVQYADLKLPDGWFGGRPYENCHQLTFMELRPHKLLLELDNQLLLVFTDVNTVRVEGSELVLTDFAQLVLDWQGYGDLIPHVDVYRQGSVTLVPPLGTVIT